MILPIVIRTRNRAQLLHLTLQSLWATCPEARPVILDDASDDPATLDYLEGRPVTCPPLVWPEDADWRKCVSDCLPSAERLPGLDRARCEQIIMYPQRRGVVNAHFAACALAAAKWPDVPALLLEDDALFTTGWHERLLECIGTVMELDRRPAFLSLYDRHDGLCEHDVMELQESVPRQFVPPNLSTMRRGMLRLALMHARNEQKPAIEAAIRQRRADNLARGVRKLRSDDTRWMAGGVGYVVWPGTIPQPETPAPVGQAGGDMAVQTAAAQAGYGLWTCCPSLIQHIGIHSLARPGRDRLRYVRYLAGPPVIGA